MAPEEKTGKKREGKEMPFLEHLEELRGVLLQSFVVVGALALVAWFVAPGAVDVMTAPAGRLVFLGPAEAFTLRLKVSLFLGFLVALPFVLFKVWSFVAPGLFEKEKKALGLVVVGSTVLFIAGALFGFFVLVPFAFRFLLGFATDNLQPMISAGNYFGFVTKLVIAFGVVFQLPLVVSMLTYAGLVKADWLLRNWKLALVVIAICSAFLTPPDVASQMMMGIPVTALYFLSAGLSILIERRKRREKEAAEEEEGEEDEEEVEEPPGGEEEEG
ncbi:MAG: twin-arginine translocase subunit TatC [Candidatus Eisenbacteria bacterium]